MEVYAVTREFTEWGKGIYNRLPSAVRNSLRSSGICHFLVVIRERDTNTITSFDFGPIGGDVAGLGAEDVKGSVEGSITRRPPGVPPEPLKLLRVMVDLIGGVTRQLREEIFKHSHSEGPGVGSPTTWVDTLGAVAPRGSIPEGGLAALKLVSTPAGGESFLLMHARWKKLEQDICYRHVGERVADTYFVPRNVHEERRGYQVAGHRRGVVRRKTGACGPREDEPR